MSTSQYHQGDLVWAKIKGCSWWPASFSRTEKGRNGSEPQALVNFVGESTHAVLTFDKIVPYKDGYDQYSVTKKRSLLDAIKFADSINAGKTTYQGMTEGCESPPLIR